MRILYVLVVITLHKFILCKKLRHLTTSDDSIENLLIYKDCRRKGDDKQQKEILAGPVFPPPPPPPPPPQCPCPRVCCSLCCDCGNFQSQTSIMSQQIQPIQSPIQPWSPPLDMGQNIPPPPPRKKKPLKFPPPIGGRRDLSSAREHIKGLIAQDQDIKKILKDLVRVTMQKVDVIETIKARHAGEQVQMRKEETGNEKVDKVDNVSEEEDL